MNTIVEAPQRRLSAAAAPSSTGWKPSISGTFSETVVVQLVSFAWMDLQVLWKLI